METTPFTVEDRYPSRYRTSVTIVDVASDPLRVSAALWKAGFATPGASFTETAAANEYLGHDAAGYAWFRLGLTGDIHKAPVSLDGGIFWPYSA